MVHYCKQPDNATKSAKAKGSYLRVHFKNTREAAKTLKSMTLRRAQRYLKNVIAHKECVPFRRFAGGTGRCSQAKQFGFTRGRWPKKSAEFLLQLLENAESNAEFKGLDVERLVVEHIAVQPAPTMRRRTHRAHGRIGPYVSSPCHIQVILSEREDVVSAKVSEADATRKKKESKKKMKRKLATMRE